MFYFLAGVFFGAAITWLWAQQRKQSSLFQQLLEKQSLNPDKPEYLSLRDELLFLENRLEEVETNLGRTASPAGRPACTAPPAGQKSGQAVPAGAKQAEVLRLWQEGGSRQEIAAKTGLGRGKVDLILSMGRFGDNRGDNTKDEGVKER